ncbi:hypothetical protein PDESU_04903 [Pontiella desulfatans]|uniref:RNA polymerase sigma-70 region 2 domain-containing protein n=1 Tax=Pontiella desulfatans TaxID=2750659 RepID=A0A6C2U874_PONDE|nr:RNA polymerase sigma factor [Pontiella desulfatans]VGO16312.1 hypothetical protein PDESU_04903 [Pontiella desulfatans]
MGEEFLTRNTLLQRAKDPKDERAWSEFVSYYETFIFILLRQMNVPQQDCDDLTQAVLVKVWKKLAMFDRERAKFRTWLSTLIRNTVINHWDVQTRRWRREEKYGEVQTEPPPGLPSSPEFDVIYQKEWEAYITNLAMKNVRGEFKDNAMQVFEMALNNSSTAEIAEQLDLHTATVTRLKNRVRDRLILEVRNLREELEL